VTSEIHTANWAGADADFAPQEERAPYDFESPKPTLLQRLASKALLATAEPTILVVDISHYNGIIDWSALRASGIQGVIMKCSEGTTYKDTAFEVNWKGARDNDFAVMVYHFFRDKPAADEFDWFMTCAVNFLDDVDGNAAVALDVETNNGVTAGTRADRAFGFCELARGAGLLDGIYSSPSLVGSLFPYGETRWSYLTWQWVAHWTSAATYTLPAGWSRTLVKAWQFGISPTYSWVPRITGAHTVDCNRMYFADEIALKRWLGQIEEPGYPFMVKVFIPGVVRAAADPMAEPLWVAARDTGLTVFDATDDVDGILWYYVGSGWILAGDVEKI